MIAGGALVHDGLLGNCGDPQVLGDNPGPAVTTEFSAIFNGFTG
jgi:hypothetical protein